MAFRKKLYTTLEALQADLDAWLREYNEDTGPAGALVLRQDADADVPGHCVGGQGKLRVA